MAAGFKFRGLAFLRALLGVSLRRQLSRPDRAESSVQFSPRCFQEMRTLPAASSRAAALSCAREYCGSDSSMPSISVRSWLLLRAPRTSSTIVVAGNSKSATGSADVSTSVASGRNTQSQRSPGQHPHVESLRMATPRVSNWTRLGASVLCPPAF